MATRNPKIIDLFGNEIEVTNLSEAISQAELGTSSIYKVRPFYFDKKGIRHDIEGREGEKVALSDYNEHLLTALYQLKTDNSVASLETKINQAFVKCGWTVHHDMVVQLPTKKYQTTVGSRECVVFLRHVESENIVKVTGEYRSQGNNVLSTCWVHIPLNASDGNITDSVDQFIAEAEKAIDQSYARRMYLKIKNLKIQE